MKGHTTVDVQRNTRGRIVKVSVQRLLSYKFVHYYRSTHDYTLVLTIEFLPLVRTPTMHTKHAGAYETQRF